jgi:hypothetical protein
MGKITQIETKKTILAELFLKKNLKEFLIKTHNCIKKTTKLKEDIL